MKTFTELAIYGFIHGGDNYGEIITGVSTQLNTMSGERNGFTKTVLLMEKDGHPCTSGIGFYLENGGKDVMVFSSKRVITVPLTPQMQMEINNIK